MKWKNHLIILCWTLLSVFPVVAEEVDTPLPADVRMVIDVSGSMKLNDPANLRQPAVELLLQLLPEGSKAGIWTFGQYVNMLVPHQTVTPQWKSDAITQAAEINSVGLRTNIGGALEKANYDADNPSDSFQTSVILLTDGMVDIDKDPAKNEAEWRRIVDEVMPRLDAAGYTVHTIALSDNADSTLMDKLAIATGGMSEVAHTADDLMKIFLRVFDQAAPAEQVPLEGNKFLIDSSVEEFTALIFRNSDQQPTRLIAPDKTEYDANNKDRDVQWYRTDAYDLITLQRPIEGEWSVVADVDPDSRVTIVSDLNLLVKPLPSNLFTGDGSELSVLLQEQQRTVTDPDFLSLLSVEGSVEHQQSGQIWPQGLGENGPPANGIYHSALNIFEHEGRYQVSVTVDGKSFKRQFRHQIMVRKPFVVELQKQVDAGREKQLLSVRSHSQLIDPANTQVVARIKDPDGRSSIKPMRLTATEDWELSLLPEVEGTYQVRVRISGSDKLGNSMEFVPDPIEFHYPAGDNPFSFAEPLPEPAVEEPIDQAVIETAAEPAVAETVEEPAAESESQSSLPLYIGLGVGNILLVALAFFAYRMIMGSDKDDPLKDLDEDLDETEPEPGAEPEPVTIPEPEPEPEPEEPEMVALEEDDLIEEDEDKGEDDLKPPPVESKEEPIEPIEMDLEGLEMDMGLDLSEDNVTEQDIPMGDEPLLDDDEVEELLAGLDEPLDEPMDEFLEEELDNPETTQDDIEEELESFSLDDFAPESLDDFLDDEDSEKNKK